MTDFINVQVDEHITELPVGVKLLDVNIDNSGMIPFRCKQGICGSCRVEIISGHDNVSPAQESESKFLAQLGHNDDDVRLACQVSVYGPVTIKVGKEYRKTR